MRDPKTRRFGCAPQRDWIIAKSVPNTRRARLLGTISFKDIVERLRREARVFRISCEKGTKTKRGFHRWVVTLHADPRTIDLWHNSRGGYRAQYYVDPAIGDRANAYALNIIGSVVKQLIEQDNRRKHIWPLACKSIRHPQTRLWIGQGRWFRQRKHTDRVLHVSRWRDYDQTDCKKAAKLMIWGALMPKSDRRLVLKGQWLNKDGLPTSDPPKPSRARQINRYLYT